MPQIFDVRANENARYKRNELELWPVVSVRGLLYLFTISFNFLTNILCHISRRANFLVQTIAEVGNLGQRRICF